MNAIEWPRNGDAPSNVQFIMRFANPQDNGLPFEGPSSAGWTAFYRARFKRQTGYHQGFWWGPFASFFWDGGAPNTYMGVHPYPPGGGSGVDHNWEIAHSGGDSTTTLGGGTLAVQKDRWYTVAARSTHNVDDSETYRAYCDLPSTANANIIEASTSTTYGETNPPDPYFYIGDSGWSTPGAERSGCQMKEFLVVGTAMTESDIVAQAANLSLLTPASISGGVWFYKRQWERADFDVEGRVRSPVLCDYTGKAFTFVDERYRPKVVQVPSDYVLRHSYTRRGRGRR